MRSNLNCFCLRSRIQALGQARRRHDVETKSLQDTGVVAAKDHMTVKDYFKVEKSIGRKVGS